MRPLVVGPGEVATPYGTALSDLLATRSLTEAVIASAFLTTAGAERLVDAVRRAPSGARITVVIGSMAGFTRKAAIRYLQSFVSGRRRKLLSARLRLVYPFEIDPRYPCFHVKAAYARVGQRGHLAIVGSHNLTDEGLESSGELGVWLEGAPARSIGETLRHWLKKETLWSEELRRYKEAKRIPGLRHRRTPRRGRPTGYADVAPLQEMVALSAAEEKRFDRLCHDHDAIHEDGWRTPGLLARKVDAPSAGSVFDAVDYISQNDGQNGWGIGARRGLAKAIRWFPDPKSDEGLLLYRWLRRYRVTPAAIRIAKACGVFEKEQPTGKQLWAFENRLRNERVRGWR